MPPAGPGSGYPPPQANPYGSYAPAPPSGAYGAPVVGTLPYVEANFGPVASFGQRAGAYLIDAALTLIGLIPMFIGMFMMISGAASASSEFNYETGVYETSGGSGALAGFGVLMMFVGGLVSFGIWLWNRVFKMGRTGQSVGKRVVGLKLINAETGQPVGAGSSFLREVVHSLANQIFYLSFLWMLWDANRQTLADMVIKSNDIVVPKS
ncbi:MAG: RDD family protein [Phycicoccus sp.]|nr:RDD family protein [Phycicoccus sp.]